MKTLKGFVCQRARPEGSMAEGWLVQESLVFIISRHVIGDEPQGQGSQRKMDTVFREKAMKFIIVVNSEPM